MKQKTCSKNTGNPSWIEVSKRIAFLIDFHKMTVSVLKSHFSKQKSNIVSYRIYKSFRNNSFRNELCDLCKIEYRHFLNIFWIFWINMLPSKKIVSEQMKVTLCRELAKPSWKGLNCTIDPWKKKSAISRQVCTTQWNYCINLLRETTEAAAWGLQLY